MVCEPAGPPVREWVSEIDESLKLFIEDDQLKKSTKKPISDKDKIDAMNVKSQITPETVLKAQISSYK